MVSASVETNAVGTLVLSSLAVMAVFLDTTALFVAFPDIIASFPKVAPQQLSWVLNGYTIVFAAVLVPMGKLADKPVTRRSFWPALRCSPWPL